MSDGDCLPDRDSFYVYLILLQTIDRIVLKIRPRQLYFNPFQFRAYCLITEALRGPVRIMDRAVD